MQLLRTDLIDGSFPCVESSRCGPGLSQLVSGRRSWDSEELQQSDQEGNGNVRMRSTNGSIATGGVIYGMVGIGIQSRAGCWSSQGMAYSAYELVRVRVGIPIPPAKRNANFMHGVSPFFLIAPVKTQKVRPARHKALQNFNKTLTLHLDPKD